MLVYFPRLGIFELRDSFFRGPIWPIPISIRLKKSGSFCAGQVPGTSHVATRPKKHTCERRICPSLSRPFAAGPASSLFVVVQSVLDVIRIPGTTNGSSSFSGSFPLFFCFFFVGWFFKKKTDTWANNIVRRCLLYFLLLRSIFFSFFFAFLSLPKCMHQGRVVIVLLYQRSSLCIRTSFLNRAGTIAHSPRYVHVTRVHPQPKR